MAVKNGDKPLGNIKRVAVADELNQDPAQYPLKSGRLVTFPDIFDLPTEEAEDFLEQLNSIGQSGKVTPILKRWLSKDDYEALNAEYPTLRKIKPVLEAVLGYYEGVWGGPGEDTASES